MWRQESETGSWYDDGKGSVMVDAYGTYIYEGDAYYQIGTEIIAEVNIKEWLDNVRWLA